jgi:hypothetical protein
VIPDLLNVMKQISVVCYFILVAANSFAQKNIDGLIQAEKKFAGYSVSHSTKEAFLEFLDSSGIVFNQGKAVNGIQIWNSREKRSGVLNWGPQYAEISSSGDFGYTTGPWTFQNSINDSIVARGQYTTVWHINKQGEWKFLIDLGIDNAPACIPGEVNKINVTKTAIRQKDTLTLEGSEKDFIKIFNQNPVEAYKKYLSAESILNRTGHSFIVTADGKNNIIENMPSSLQYSVDGWNISSGLDMGYVYGRTELNGKAENYQRIWRHEKGGWKIALEVLRQ